MKKILSLFLAMILIVSILPISIMALEDAGSYDPNQGSDKGDFDDLFGNYCKNSADGVHDYSAATCTKPQTCKSCGDTLGVANGHRWLSATCSAPKTCNTCGATEGVASGHSWLEATCQAPKTCAVCGATEGNKLDHLYDNPHCDIECKRCHEVRQAPHKWKTTYDTDGDYHWYQCEKCNAVKGTKELHKYDNNNDLDCNICGKVREAVTHVYDNACDATCNTCGHTREPNHAYVLKSNSSKHWQQCSACGATASEQTHNYSDGCDTSCNTCGVVRTVTHSYDNGTDIKVATCTETGLKLYKCRVCIETKTETIPKLSAHVYDGSSDAECNSCGHIRELSDISSDVAANDDNNLSSLSIEGVKLSPDFSQSTVSYSVSVPFSTNKLKITATPKDSKAKVVINNPELVAGGKTTVTITVTAQNGVTKTYTVIVTRAADSSTETPSDTPDDNTPSATPDENTSSGTSDDVHSNTPDVDNQFAWWILGAVIALLGLGTGAVVVLGIKSKKKK